jgi:hypothetical protein
LELCRPVRISQEDARLFRRFTIRRVVLTAMCVAAAIMGYILWFEYRSRMLRSPLMYPEPYAVAFMGFIGGAVAIWVFLMLATDLPTFIWRGHDRSPQDLAPLHHYACAPLALLPYPMLALGLTGMFAAEAKAGLLAAFTFYGTCGCLLILTVLMWIFPLVLMSAATGCSRKQTVWLALYLPLHWALMAVLSLLILLSFTLTTSMYFSY